MVFGAFTAAELTMLKFKNTNGTCQAFKALDIIEVSLVCSKEMEDCSVGKLKDGLTLVEVE